MSMTQPMSTLTRGQLAPLLLRSLPVLRSTLPYSAGQRHVFRRNDLRRGRADCFATPPLDPARTGMALSAHLERLAAQGHIRICTVYKLHVRIQRDRKTAWLQHGEPLRSSHAQ
jgi:hypothetical protein